MLNKKIVAAAVAAAFTQGALATVDVDATATQKITYASELVTAGSTVLTVDNAANLLDIQAATQATEKKYSDPTENPLSNPWRE